MTDDFGDNGGPKTIYGGSGWVAIHRSLRSHWLVGFGQPVKPMDPERGSFSRSEAFQDLIMECRYEPGFVNNGGRKMELKPGQLVGAVSWLANRWNWTPKTVRGFLDKLEADETIKVEQPGTENGTQKGKQSSVITLCNYENYQFSPTAEGQATGHAEGKQGASKGQAEGNNTKDNKGTREQGKSPLPPTGGGAPEATTEAKAEGKTEAKSKRTTKRDFTADEIALTDEAVAAYNEAAERHGFYRATVVDATRRRRLLLRLNDIGGLDNFRIALATIPSVPFLMGKAAPRPGDEPFKLDLDRLLSDGSQLGNVLLKLIDKAAGKSAGTQAPAPWWRDPARSRISADEWRERIKTHANGTWPIDKLGPAPGSAQCIVPRPIVSEMQLERIYDQHGFKQSHAPTPDWMRKHEEPKP